MSKRSSEQPAKRPSEESLGATDSSGATGKRRSSGGASYSKIIESSGADLVKKLEELWKKTPSDFTDEERASFLNNIRAEGMFDSKDLVKAKLMPPLRLEQQGVFFPIDLPTHGIEEVKELLQKAMANSEGPPSVGVHAAGSAPVAGGFFVKTK